MDSPLSDTVRRATAESSAAQCCQGVRAIEFPVVRYNAELVSSQLHQIEWRKDQHFVQP